jgi:uncharacterized protein (DUF362 family)
MLKPNLVRPELKQFPCNTTDKRVILAVAQVCKDAGAKEVTVGENPGYGITSRFAFRLSNLLHHMKEMDINPVFLDEEEKVNVPNPEGILFRNVKVPKPYLNADVIINIPKMKTHLQAKVSLGIKNLHGIALDEQRLLYHREDINSKLIDILRIRIPELTVIDALWALEGQSPLFGNPIPDFNLIISGTDPVAVDSVGCSTMGFDPEEIAMIRIARQQKLGCGDLSKIEVRGKKIEEVRRPFKRPILGNAGAFEKVICIEGGACSGCLSNLRHSLDRLKYEGKLDKCPVFSIYNGKPMPNNENIDKWEGDLFLFGNCSAELVFSQVERRSIATFIPGCPPHIFDLYNQILTKYNIE